MNTEFYSTNTYRNTISEKKVQISEKDKILKKLSMNFRKKSVSNIDNLKLLYKNNVISNSRNLKNADNLGMRSLK